MCSTYYIYADQRGTFSETPSDSGLAAANETEAITRTIGGAWIGNSASINGGNPTWNYGTKNYATQYDDGDDYYTGAVEETTASDTVNIQANYTSELVGSFFIGQWDKPT